MVAPSGREKEASSLLTRKSSSVTLRLTGRVPELLVVLNATSHTLIILRKNSVSGILAMTLPLTFDVSTCKPAHLNTY